MSRFTQYFCIKAQIFNRKLPRLAIILSQLINEFCYIYIFGNDDILNTCNGLLVRSIIVPVFYRKIPAGSGKYLFRDICAVRQGNGIYDRVFREMNVKECPLFRDQLKRRSRILSKWNIYKSAALLSLSLRCFILSGGCRNTEAKTKEQNKNRE